MRSKPCYGLRLMLPAKSSPIAHISFESVGKGRNCFDCEQSEARDKIVFTASLQQAKPLEGIQVLTIVVDGIGALVDD